MMGHRIHGVPVVDLRNNGIGDAVVGCWVIHSARAVNRPVQMNAGGWDDVAALLDLPAGSLVDEDVHDSVRPNLGSLRFDHDDPDTPMSAFQVLCRSLGLPPLQSVRPPYCERAEDGDWADSQWLKVDPSHRRTRVLLFPEAAWPIRTWPLAYFIDLANALVGRGYAVAAMSGTQDVVRHMPCYWWGGFNVRQAAAMCRRAHLVVANESGPAHLASVIGARTAAICGATDPRIIFGHEPNVAGIRIDAGILSCVSCHFAGARGYRHACDVGGCQALLRLDPATVIDEVCRMLEAVHGGEPELCR